MLFGSRGTLGNCPGHFVVKDLGVYLTFLKCLNINLFSTVLFRKQWQTTKCKLWITNCCLERGMISLLYRACNRFCFWFVKASLSVHHYGRGPYCLLLVVSPEMFLEVAGQTDPRQKTSVTVRSVERWVIIRQRQHDIWLVYGASLCGFFISCSLHICYSNGDLTMPDIVINNNVLLVPKISAALYGGFKGVFLLLFQTS